MGFTAKKVEKWLILIKLLQIIIHNFTLNFKPFMIFGFNEVQHKDFKNNFLKSVILQLSYNKVLDFQDKRQKIENFFKDLFPRVGVPTSSGIHITFKNASTPVLEQVNNEDKIEMKSLSGQKTLLISNTSIVFTTTGKEYINYVQLESDMCKIQEYFTHCEIKELTRISIRKINIVDFKNALGDPFTIFQSLINTELVGNLAYFPSSTYLKQNIQNLTFKKDVYTFNIKYGLNMQNPQPDIGQLLIDFDLILTDKISVTNLFTITDEINQEIFNAFNWVVSENFINLMNG